MHVVVPVPRLPVSCQTLDELRFIGHELAASATGNQPLGGGVAFGLVGDCVPFLVALGGGDGMVLGLGNGFGGGYSEVRWVVMRTTAAVVRPAVTAYRPVWLWPGAFVRVPRSSSALGIAGRKRCDGFLSLVVGVRHGCSPLPEGHWPLTVDLFLAVVKAT